VSVVVPLIFPRVLELFTRSQTMRATLNHLPTEGGQSCSESHDTIRIWSRPRRLRAPPQDRNQLKNQRFFPLKKRKENR